MSAVVKFFDLISETFEKYIPWHSEADKQNAQAIVAAARAEMDPTANADAGAAENAPAHVVEETPAGATENPPVTPADSSVVDAEASNAGAPATDPANDTPETPAPVSTVSAVVNTAADFVYPGAYTPPPAE